MAVRDFISRRLLPIFPPVLRGIGTGLSLRSKFEIASARDVFVSANYWRLFEFIDSPPKIVLDLGAHCGHFSILLHQICLEKFGIDKASYTLVEPMTRLVRSASRALEEAGIAGQSRIVRGAVGRDVGTARLVVNRKNLLISSTTRPAAFGSMIEEVPIVDPTEFLPPSQSIDILKCDIEGAEYDVFATHPSLFSRANLVAMELHGAADRQQRLLGDLQVIGLSVVSTVIKNGDDSLVILRRVCGDE